MPIYEYVCIECAHELETMQKMSDRPLVFCPKCSSETLKKKISAAAFQLKGTGWYETDFKNPQSKDKDKDKDKDKAADGKTSGGDSATDARAESKSAESASAKPSSADKPKPSKSATQQATTA